MHVGSWTIPSAVTGWARLVHVKPRQFVCMPITVAVVVPVGWKHVIVAKVHQRLRNWRVRMRQRYAVQKNHKDKLGKEVGKQWKAMRKQKKKNNEMRNYDWLQIHWPHYGVGRREPMPHHTTH